VSRSGVFFASLLVSLGRPSWWLLSVAGFLARGGILLAILPIVNLPSPLVLSNLVAPVVVPLALGHVDAGVLAAIAVVVGGLLAWLIVGGLVGATTDLALIRDGIAAAREEGVTGRAPGDAKDAEAGSPLRPEERGGAALIGRIFVVRLLAHLPFAVVLVVGTVGIIQVAYAELTRPANVDTPLVLRVVAAAAWPIAAIAIAWFGGELAGGIAARRIVLAGDGVRAALTSAAAALVRQPRSTVIPAVVMTIPLALILGGTLGGARVAWLRADGALTDPTIDATALIAALATLVVIWLAALLLIGVVTAARSAALTFEAVRIDTEGVRDAASSGESGNAIGGTFGASTHHRPGDRPLGDDGGSL
jgi:hypothetical protein